MITIEEHSISGGLGSIINNFLMMNGYNDVSTLNFGVPESFIPHGSYSELIDHVGLTPEKISEKCIKDFSLKAPSFSQI